MEQHYRGSSTAANSEHRADTPDSERIEPISTRVNPFASPYGSMPASAVGSTTALQMPPSRYFHSRRIAKESVEKPWLGKKDPREKWVTIFPILGILIGFGLSGFLIYEGLMSVQNHVYCPVLNEDWSSGKIDPTVWTQEQQTGGFGNGEFEVTTANGENAFIKDGALVIKPTLQDATLVEKDGSYINLLDSNSCTAPELNWASCVTGTNSTNGTIVNPVKSARLTTRINANMTGSKGAAIKFGRVEVVAELPAGDWMWPAIWLLPVNNTYGPWPASGEIDIMESRGNNYTDPQGGNNVISSTLHWGPDQGNDGWWQNNNKRQALHTTYAAGKHTFGLEWSEKYLFTYIDTRLAQVMYVNFDKSFWSKGNFPPSSENGTRLVNPWASTGRSSTPFDQDFYLILNVAIGGTNGWFADGVNSKPWVDSSSTAKRDFWNARDQWYPTWEQGGQMTIHSVKMWQQQGYNGC